MNDYVIRNTPIPRHTRIIRMSSPKLNNVILVGCVTSYVSILFAGVSAEVPLLAFCRVSRHLTSDTSWYVRGNGVYCYLLCIIYVD